MKRPDRVSLKVSVILVLMTTITLSGCASAWKKYPISSNPDYSCSTVGVAGYDYYIWDCLNNEHVVVYQFFGEMFTYTPAQIEKTKCGEVTEFEQKARIQTQMRNACERPAKPWQP